MKGADKIDAGLKKMQTCEDQSHGICSMYVLLELEFMTAVPQGLK